MPKSAIQRRKRLRPLDIDDTAPCSDLRTSSFVVYRRSGSGQYSEYVIQRGVRGLTGKAGTPWHCATWSSLASWCRLRRESTALSHVADSVTCRETEIQSRPERSWSSRQSSLRSQTRVGTQQPLESALSDVIAGVAAPRDKMDRRNARGRAGSARRRQEVAVDILPIRGSGATTTKTAAAVAGHA